jgi:hypothetical protein
MAVEGVEQEIDEPHIFFFSEAAAE